MIANFDDIIPSLNSIGFRVYKQKEDTKLRRRLILIDKDHRYGLVDEQECR